MDQDNAIEKQRHENFVKTVCQTGVVWGLENDEGFAMSSSGEYEDADGEAVDLICYWSNKNLAESCKNEEWVEYRTTEIPLAEFLENWCIGMSEDELLIGTDFDKDLSGYEIDPLDLIIEISKELKSQGKKITLQNYKSIDELVAEIESILGDE